MTPRAFSLLCVLITLIQIAHSSKLAGKDSASSSRVIQYRGPMPALKRSLWGQKVELKFELYRSPTAGVPFWSETRQLKVSESGWVDVNLGQVEPLPDEAFQSPFRFLSIWHAHVEFVPRKQVVSVVYVTSTAQAGPPKDAYHDSPLAQAKSAAVQTPNREARLDTLVNCGSYSMETHPRRAMTWLEAEKVATRLSAPLPTFDEWYGAYDGKTAKELAGMTGHYEWVIPWVYEPAIHARMHDLYRGKPAACYYEELSPLNEYPFRLVQRHANAKSQ